MQQGGFLDARSRHPFGMGAVIAAHTVVLTAIILSPPEFIQHRIPILTVYPVDETTPPPPIEKHQEKARQQPTHKPEQITKPDVIVPTRDATDTVLKVDQTPTFPPLLPSTGTIPQIAISDPVFVQARPNMSADAMQPPYPAALARAEIEGKAEIRILIGIDGRVKQVDEVSSTDPGFFEATRQQALRHWRFKPATRDGVPVESWRTMTVRFQLQA
ncbi:energy transducer TonB [Flavisphingomonas formosensis]|uniref:energy transducer TonB n=1 Tax=Flavisphingomonas formosensis TaxID=861534 RepID=UPI0012F7C7E8|nr:energy transducer TonB [Sphingomonas formosensis]